MTKPNINPENDQLPKLETVKLLLANNQINAHVGITHVYEQPKIYIWASIECQVKPTSANIRKAAEENINLSPETKQRIQKLLKKLNHGRSQ